MGLFWRERVEEDLERLRADAVKTKRPNCRFGATGEPSPPVPLLADGTPPPVPGHTPEEPAHVARDWEPQPSRRYQAQTAVGALFTGVGISFTGLFAGALGVQIDQLRAIDRQAALIEAEGRARTAGEQAWAENRRETALQAQTLAIGAGTFLSRRSDTLRPPYGHTIEKYPRSTILLGTSNRRQILADPTGSRRSWCVPVHVKEIDRKLLESLRDQLWAQALAAFRVKTDYHWWLTPDEEAARETDALQFELEDPELEKIQTYLNGQDDDWVSVSAIAKGIGLEGEGRRASKAESTPSPRR